MAEATPRPSGNIYDLGYRTYEGERLGRRHAFEALYVYSFRAVFGLGRSGMNKVFPIGLALLALTPAGIQLAVAALAPAELELIKPEDYFGPAGIWIVMALFCSVVAPEIVGRDQRNRTLPLYFARALSRRDYVSAKIAALFIAVLLVLLTPQIMLFAGAALSTQQVLEYVRDNIDILPSVLGSCISTAAIMSTVSLAVASFSPKRALATGTTLTFFVIFTLLGRTLVETTTGSARDWVILLSPLDVANGINYWLFNARPPAEIPLALTDTPGIVFVGAALIYVGGALTILYRRFLRLNV